MRDLEVLLASVRSSDSRQQLGEAVRAYQAGAYRAAIISTWVAVSLDLVGKLRELADDGDGAARTKIEELDRAISTQDVKVLQRFESELLDVSHETFEMLSGRVRTCSLACSRTDISVPTQPSPPPIKCSVRVRKMHGPTWPTRSTRCCAIPHPWSTDSCALSPRSGNFCLARESFRTSRLRARALLHASSRICPATTGRASC